MVILVMFGSYLLTQLVTAAITVTYEKVDDEMLMTLARQATLTKMKKENDKKQNGGGGGGGNQDDEESKVAYDEDGDPIKDPYAVKKTSKKGGGGKFTMPFGMPSRLPQQESQMSLGGFSGGGGGGGGGSLSSLQVPPLPPVMALPQAKPLVNQVASPTSLMLSPSSGGGGGGGGGNSGRGTGPVSTLGGAPSQSITDAGGNSMRSGIEMVNSPTNQSVRSTPLSPNPPPPAAVHHNLGAKHWDYDSPTAQNMELQ
jgi:hypothetical protein